MILFLFFILGIKGLEYSFSLDFKTITFTGNGALSQKFYRDTGNYWTYTKIILENGINETGNSCFDGSSAAVQIILPKSCKK